jgi:integrase
MEAKRLLAALDESVRNLARGALLTGLRLGELEALTAADVDKDHVRVRESKSGKPRTVPLNKAGAAFFSQLVTEKQPDAHVFERISRIYVSRQMRAGCIAADITPPAVFHDLRRSYGSLLLNAGAAADHIQELLGHADLRMTRRAYAHMKDKTLVNAVKKLPSFG